MPEKNVEKVVTGTILSIRQSHAFFETAKLDFLLQTVRFVKYQNRSNWANFLCLFFAKWRIGHEFNHRLNKEGEGKMKSTFHEIELGQAVSQNATSVGTEQLIVKLKSDGPPGVQIQIKQNTNDQTSTASSISVDQHSLQKLVQWLREEGAVQ